MRGLIRGALVPLALAACASAGASPGKLEDALRHCSEQSEPAERLSCFDALVKTLPAVKADQFGLTSDIKERRDPVAAQASKEETLAARIADLRHAAHGEWIFTLDNQQVWVEAEAHPNIEFSAGESVRIEHGAMSSLWLVADKHRDQIF